MTVSYNATVSFSSNLRVIAFILAVMVRASDAAPIECQSNATHIAWRVDGMASEDGAATLPRTLKSPTHDAVVDSSSDDHSSCWIQSYQAARLDAYTFLRQHVLPFEEPFLETLGFAAVDHTTPRPDGLDVGLVQETIDYALQAKQRWEHADSLPRSLWLQYVLPYASVNEARTSWRPILWNRLEALVSSLQPATVRTIVAALNEHLWTILGPDGRTITFVSGQTPRLFDPMSVLVYGYASCTGISLLFVNALRTVGIPARLVGTPAWHAGAEGNHNWVEVWDVTSNAWIFLEGSPNQTQVQTMDDGPCERWFCAASYWKNGTRAFAVSLEGPTFFPMAWERSNEDVPGVEVTERYRAVCSQC